MKQTRLLVLILLTAVGAVAAAVTPPTDLSLRGIVEWVAVGGHVASGTTLPTVGPVGTRFTRLNAPTKPVEYRSTGSAWYPMWTWNHRDLTNLSYEISGHGIVPPSFGGTGGANASEARFYLDVFSKASTTALIDDLSGVTASPAARAVLDVYSTTEVDNKIANTIGYLRYYVSASATDVLGYGSLSVLPESTGTSYTSPALATTTLTATTARITASGSPNIAQTVAGDFPFTVTCKKTGTADVAFQVTLWKRDLAGNEIEFASSAVNIISNTAPQQLTFNTTSLTTLNWAATDRLVLRSYVARTGTGSNPTVTFYYGNGYQSFITLSVGANGVFARQDLSNVPPVEGRASLGFPDSTGKPGYVLSVGTDTSTLAWSAGEFQRSMVVWDEMNLRSGTHAQTEFASSSLTMARVPGRMSDYPSTRMNEFMQGFSLQLSDLGGGIYPASGSYLCAQKDLGSVKTCSLDKMLTKDTGGFGTVTYEYRSSSDGTAWSAWTTLAPVTLMCRYLEFRVKLNTSDSAQTPRISVLTETLKLAGLDVYGTNSPVYAADNPVGTWIDFGYAYIAQPSITVSAIGSGTTADILSVSRFGFHVRVRDLSGASMNGMINWTAKGY